jgi:hypothetical protein
MTRFIRFHFVRHGLFRQCAFGCTWPVCSELQATNPAQDHIFAKSDGLGATVPAFSTFRGFKASFKLHPQWPNAG